MAFKIKPPHVAFSLVAIALVLDYFFPQFRVIKKPMNLIGVIILAGGIALSSLGAFNFIKKKTPIIPGETPKFMVAEGPYRFTRNPMYLGITIALTGLAILNRNILAFIAPLAFFIAVSFVYVPFEEKLMEKTFGKKYTRYKIKVRRWI